MFKRFLNIFTCFAIVILLLLNGTAHEFLHTFTNDEDTVDCVHNDHAHGATFENEHHHCDFLDLQSPVFVHVGFSFTLNIFVQHVNYFSNTIPQFVVQELPHTALRGPPGC